MEHQMKYQDLLLPRMGDGRRGDLERKVLDRGLLSSFAKAVRDAKRFDYILEGEPAFFDFKVFAEDEVTEAQSKQERSNRKLSRLFSRVIPLLAYAYLTPGPNPHYRDSEVLQLYIKALEYCYGRGLDEHSWMTDHAGRASALALDQGLVRASGDYSSVSLHLGGFCQSIFLMRTPLQEAGLLDKYRDVIRNLAVNNGPMYPAFFEIARGDAGITFSQGLSPAESYHLNADAIRLFADYFWPYYLLIEDPDEYQQMTDIVRNVIVVNVDRKPGTQDTIKPDGVGFHHHAAYVGGYSPYTFEVFAQLLYLLSDTDLVSQAHLETVKVALESFRVMAQRYTVSSSLNGRLIMGDADGASVAITKAMCLLAHPDGFDDLDMQKRFGEFFDPDYFLSGERLADYYKGKRGVSIRGLGIYRLISDVVDLGVAPAETPSGTWIKPYAAAAFHRRDDWLVTARGFSRYFWDYEGPLNKHQNSFGQNWSYGLLEVFSAGEPVSRAGSGYDLSQGWDWYHVPGTTASHYPIERRTLREVEERRDRHGIVQSSVHRNYNSRTFVGGVSLGDHGLFVQDLEAVPFTSPTDLVARKSYFCVGDVVVAVGSGISGGTGEEETHTTLFQTCLADADVPTLLDGRELRGLEVDTSVVAGNSVGMTDAVGNSYYLVRSSANMRYTRTRQKSMTPAYTATEGDYVQAWINHGIKPHDDRYVYVVAPADRDGLELSRLTADPDSVFRVLSGDRLHIVCFPEHRITGYAFYEDIDTPDTVIVKRSSLQATVMTRMVEGGVQLAASVPDLGWVSDLDALKEKGLGYANRHYIRQEAKEHRLQLVLRGRWLLASSDDDDVRSRIEADETTLELTCKDGLTEQVLLKSAE